MGGKQQRLQAGGAAMWKRGNRKQLHLIPCKGGRGLRPLAEAPHGPQSCRCLRRCMRRPHSSIPSAGSTSTCRCCQWRSRWGYLLVSFFCWSMPWHRRRMWHLMHHTSPRKGGGTVFALLYPLSLCLFAGLPGSAHALPRGPQLGLPAHAAQHGTGGGALCEELVDGVLAWLKFPSRVEQQACQATRTRAIVLCRVLLNCRNVQAWGRGRLAKS